MFIERDHSFNCQSEEATLGIDCESSEYLYRIKYVLKTVKNFKELFRTAADSFFFVDKIGIYYFYRLKFCKNIIKDRV